jgi:hypothetical protein
LCRPDPPLTESQCGHERLALDAAIRRIEGERLSLVEAASLEVPAEEVPVAVDGLHVGRIEPRIEWPTMTMPSGERSSHLLFNFCAINCTEQSGISSAFPLAIPQGG